MTTTTELPNFEDPAWNAERIRLEGIVNTAVIQLIAHAGPVGGITQRIKALNGMTYEITIKREAQNANLNS